MENLFSKSLLDISSLKSGFLEQNDKQLKNSIRINEQYNLQEIRHKCKNCLSKLDENPPDIFNHGVGYKICQNCSHLNGDREDSEVFTNWLYKDEGGTNYSSNYLEDYLKRVSNIYLPKAKFLKDSLYKNCGIKTFSLFDFGSGGGHFVYAVNSLGIECKGVDISEKLIGLAKKAWNESKVFKTDPPFSCVSSENHLIKEILDSKYEVISFIGVIEHLRNPNNVFEAFNKSKSKYMFFSVPLFSLSTFIENISTNTFPRQLSGGHTHLYTHESIDYFCREYDFVKISSWHFGTDAMDLRRSLIIESSKNGISEKARKIIEDRFFSPSIMNEFQQVLDRHFAGSELHMLVQKK